MFGQQKSMFGSTAFGAGGAGTSAFGNTFGAANKPVGVAFGTTQQPQAGTAGGMFGTGAPGTTGFSTGGGGLFGSSAAPTAAPAGGLFGASSAGTGFNFSSTTPAAGGSLFGQQLAAPATGGGLFGQPAAQPATGSMFGTSAAQQSGTTVKFNAIVGTDTMVRNNQTVQTQTKHQCITAMNEYANKSLEELRVEDYLASRKGPQAGSSGAFTFSSQPTATGGLFGANTATQQNTGGGLFGSKPLFGTTTTTQSTAGGGLFGTSTVAAPSVGGGLFGAATQNKPAFGAPTTSAFSFGSTPAPAFGTATSTAAGGLFSSTAQQPAFGSTFGQPAAQQSGGLFGAKPAFGAAPTTQSTGFAFGNTATQQPTAPAFGAAAPVGGGLFGSKPAGAPAFGATAPTSTGFGAFGAPSTSGGLFGNTAQRPSLFGGAPATSTFGVAPAPGTAPFGAAGTGTLGQPGSSLFGGTAGGMGGLFGSKPAGTGLFGGTNYGQPSTFGQQQPAAAPSNPVAEQALLKQQILALTNAPYGDASFRDLLSDSSREAHLRPLDRTAQREAIKREILPAPVLAHMAALSPSACKPLPRPSPRVLTTMIRTEERNDESITTLPPPEFRSGGGSRGGHPILDSSMNTSGMGRQLLRGDDDDRRPITSPIIGSPPVRSMMDRSADDPRKHLDFSVTFQEDARGSSPERRGDRSLHESNRQEINRLYPDLQRERQAYDETLPDISVASAKRPHPTGIVLTRPEYYTKPNMDELAKMVDTNGDCILLDGFTVGRHGYGSVYWPGEINVANLNLDEIVHFRHKEVTVYPDDDNKPEQGRGLNRQAEITLERVWPVDTGLKSPVKSPEKLQQLKYREKLEVASQRMGAEFKDYRPETGSWVFIVAHFTKYGLVSEADEETPRIEEITRTDADLDLMAKIQHEKVLQRAPAMPTTAEEPQLFDSSYAILPIPMFGEKEPAIMDVTAPEWTYSALDSTENFRDVLPIVPLSAKQKRLDQLRSSFVDDGQPTSVSYDETAIQLPSRKRDSRLLRDVLDKSQSFLDQLYARDGRQPDDGAMEQSGEGDESQQQPELPLVIHKPALDPTSFTGLPKINTLAQVAYQDSLIYGRTVCHVDAGLFHGRRFRACLTPASATYAVECNDEGSGLFPIGILHHASFATSTQYEKKDVVDVMTCVYESCRFESGSLTVAKGEDLLKHLLALHIGRDSLPSPVAQMLQLCHALWSTPDDPAASKMAVANWIRTLTKPYTESRVQQFLSEGQVSAAILECLLGGLDERAVQLAVADGRAQLALSIASAHAARAFMLEQLGHWYDLKLDTQMDPNDIKSWMVLSGALQWHLSDGTLLNVVQDESEWLRVLGIMLWHDVRDLNQVAKDKPMYFDLSAAILAYRDCAEAGTVPPPSAPCPQDQPQDQSCDVLYNIVQLYAKPSLPLGSVITEQACGVAGTDAFVSWQLYQVLQSLGFPRMETDASMLVQMSQQLVAMDLHGWALFPLLHIRESNSRNRMIRDLVYRCPDNIASSIETLPFLDQADIEDVLHYGQALHARAQGDRTSELEHLLSAGEWNLAHQLLCDHVAAEALVNANENLNNFQKQIDRLAEHAEEIVTWKTGGQIYSNYLNVIQVIRDLDLTLEDEESMEQLKTNLVEVAKSMCHIAESTTIQRYCKQGMSQKISEAILLFYEEADYPDVAPVLLNLGPSTNIQLCKKISRAVLKHRKLFL